MKEERNVETEKIVRLQESTSTRETQVDALLPPILEELERLNLLMSDPKIIDLSILLSAEKHLNNLLATLSAAQGVLPNIRRVLVRRIAEVAQPLLLSVAVTSRLREVGELSASLSKPKSLIPYAPSQT